MNFSLAREIYGLNGWCVDSQSLPSLMSILKNIQSGVALEIPETKYNAVYCYDIKSKETRLISDTWELRNDNDFDGIGVINLNGVITKGGGASSYGTKDISRMMLRMSNDNRIKGFVLRVDSGGGASNAVGLLSDTINEVKKTKPVYTLVEKGGYMASAAYGIGSAGNKIFAEDGMSVIGSVGTMIAFEGKKANTTDKNGVKNIVLYATKSTEKNKAFEEALNNDDYSLIINEILDPVNENFINTILQNRPQLKGTDFAISSASPTHTFNLPTASAANRGALSSADWSTFNGKLTGNAPITGATNTKITYDSKGLVTAGTSLAAGDMPTGIDAANIGTGAVSNTEFGYLDGVTSAIQTQINNKKDTITYGQVYTLTVVASSTVYAAITGIATFNGTESNRQFAVPVDGIVKNLYVRMNGTQSATGSLVIAVRKNGVTSSVTVTVTNADGASPTKSDNVNTLSITAGDLLSFQLINNATVASAGITSIAIIIERT